jgi:uncharacterized protein YqfB (UPF0267 family)
MQPNDITFFSVTITMSMKPAMLRVGRYEDDGYFCTITSTVV